MKKKKARVIWMCESKHNGSFWANAIYPTKKDAVGLLNSKDWKAVKFIEVV